MKASIWYVVLVLLTGCHSLDRLYGTTSIPMELQSRDAVVAYLTEYDSSGFNKAFAANGNGAWSYISRQLTISEAKRRVPEYCNKIRVLGSEKCVIIDVNDEYVGEGFVPVDMQDVLGPRVKGE